MSRGIYMDHKYHGPPVIRRYSVKGITFSADDDVTAAREELASLWPELNAATDPAERDRLAARVIKLQSKIKAAGGSVSGHGAVNASHAASKNMLVRNAERRAAAAKAGQRSSRG